MRKNKITDYEWRVMEAVWGGAPLSSKEIIVKVKESMPSWNERTIRTYINRLVDKGFLRTEKEKFLMYYPLVSREDAVKKETDIFFKKIYKSSKALILSNFLKDDKLTSEEINILKKMIEEKESKNDK